MKTAFHQCLQNFLRSQKVLGQTSFPLQESVLRTFLQNEQLVLAEKRREVAIAHPLEFQAKQVSLASGTVTSSPIEEPKKVAFTLPDGDKETRWKWLKQQVLSCPQCLQHVAPGKKLVFGSGNLQADLFFCGEAPGAEEEEQGEVFVGRAGQLLTKMIKAMGLRRSDVYIGNIMNWRPETPNHIGNRPPTQEEMQFCLPYLIGQVEIVQPKVIVALGATAVHGLLGYDPQRRMRDCRGHWFTFHQIPLLVTYHPSYLLRNATIAAKRMVWEDLLRVMQFLKLPISERQQSYFL
ncbi:MAG: uracil-DNA glycosylase [Opitutales bacterium]|nr:uracil-DNA glycosylase [Opitutales bacterium]